MHPILFRIGPLTIHSYGTFLAIGFLAGIWVAVKEAERKGLSPDKILDLGFTCLVSAVVASRIPYVVFNWSDFSDNIWEIFAIWKGGLVFYGGFLGAAAAFALFVRINRLPFWKVADCCALGVPLGYFFGRLGCFSAGCCYGAETNLPWAVTFHDPYCLAPKGLSLHPTQLYLGLGSLTIFLVLFFFYRKRAPFDGAVFLVYLFSYAVLRFFVEFLRADDRGEFFLGLLSPSQTMGVAMAIVAVVLFAGRKIHASKEPQPAPQPAPGPGKGKQKGRA
ncbi:MAG: prolipoprotein diacylglyceryl transferase [Thermodesulfobacteriota bacterium]